MLVPQFFEILGGVVVDVYLWGITQSQDALQRPPEDPTGTPSASSSHLSDVFLHKSDFKEGTQFPG